ncbi:mitochondrial/chloroplast ribosomal protein L54/L37 [Amylocystis lapponica]|nr:mitochondrial/chloroplast ribosomal protein L54/L37 [Amylocystis lapponica]
MFSLRALRRPPRLTARCSLGRSYATKGAPPKAASTKDAPKDAESEEVETISRSSCPENTVLTGLAYLKDQIPVTALPDDAYPDWLWTLLEPKKIPDDGPGGKAEKYKLRKQNRQRIRDQNFMKTQ